MNLRALAVPSLINRSKRSYLADLEIELFLLANHRVLTSAEAMTKKVAGGRQLTISLILIKLGAGR
jgi:hypothetical protein